MIDYHVHLWPHAERADPSELRLERLALYCERARDRGVEEIALTEHLFRFTAVEPIADRFWRAERDPALSAQMAAYFAHHMTEDLDAYVTEVLAAKAAGLPVVLGLEVDYYPGRMDAVADLLRGYPFDVLLGSVHWLGTWMFDNLDDPVADGEWDRRGTETAWRSYTEALEELAATGTCDVLAHPDVIKLTGRFPSAALVDECQARIAEAAARSATAAEVSSAGLRKPVGEAYPSPHLLSALFAQGVPITTASDTHGPGDIADHGTELAGLIRAAGYETLCRFRSRSRTVVPVGGSPVGSGAGAGEAAPAGGP